MQARVSLPAGSPAVQGTVVRQFAPLLGYLLTPVSAAAYAMAVWSLAATMNWVGAFVITGGIFARWQVWLATAVTLQALAQHLTGAKRRKRTATS